MSARLPRLFFNYSVVISAPSRGLTQTVTQTRKRPGRMGWTQWIAHRAESTQKRRKALRHNAFRRSSYLHTQEVTGSSPVVSTKKFLISQEIRNFSLYFPVKSSLKNLTFALTNTLTNTAIVPYRTGQHRAGFPRSALLFCSFLKLFLSLLL